MSSEILLNGGIGEEMSCDSDASAVGNEEQCTAVGVSLSSFASFLIARNTRADDKKNQM
jgi:hypothetical protein